MSSKQSNRSILYLFVGFSIGLVLAITLQSVNSSITTRVIAQAEKIIGLDFAPAERDSMVSKVEGHLEDYLTLRKHTISNEVPYALNFDPLNAVISYTEERALQQARQVDRELENGQQEFSRSLFHLSNYL